MNKQALRDVYKNKRQSLSSKTRLQFDDLMLIQFQKFDFSGIRSLLTYWPMPNQAEPNTHLFSGYLRHMVPGLSIAYPVMDPDEHEFTAHQIDEDTVYKPGKFGVLEPDAPNPVDSTTIDLVFVPLLVADAEGYRVGYGKGYYDRFLATCNEGVITMGFSYFDPIEQITDTDQFDVPLHYLITPSSIYEF